MALLINKEQLIDYLKTIIYLESKKIEYDDIMSSLSNQINILRVPKTKMLFEQPTRPTYDNSNNGCIVAFIVGAFLCCGFAEINVVCAIIYFGIVGIILFYLISEKHHAKFKYEMDYKKYEYEMDLFRNENDKIGKQNEKIRLESERKVKELNNDYQYISSLYNKVDSTLNQYYALDILYKKYQNFACVSSILDYYLAGICDELGGPHGAYNKLDQEILLKSIITKLDVVINHLNDIKNNQVTLYNAIMDGYRESKSLTNKLINQNATLIETINDNGQKITAHLDAIEYSQRNNEENNRYLLDLESFKYWSNKK